MISRMSEIDIILHRLTTLYPKPIEPGLGQTLRILEDLGNPHLRLPPVIHIAGTNGKGSTLAFIRAIAQAAGLKVHAMTSPHLVKFNERFLIADREITDEALIELFRRTEDLNDGKPITFFAITTAAGFLAFAENPADLCLLETGMGGRLDSTNVVPDPALTIITNISRDHTQFLGNTLKEIAFEKAGIIKQNTPCVIGPQTQDALDEGVMAVFESRAHELNAPLYRYGHEWLFKETTNGFTLYFLDKVFECPRPNLLGAHQIANAATAVFASLLLPLLQNIDTSVIEKGITNASWPARLQPIKSGPLFDLLPGNWELWLDGGHNEAGGRILADQAKNWAVYDGKPLHLVLGMLTTKDPEPFYDHLKPYIATATAIPISNEKQGFNPEDLARRLNIDFSTDPVSALKKIVHSPQPGRILIAGSLYLAGNILKL